MENNEHNPLDSQNSIRFSSEQEERACFIDMRRSISKLLYLIEDERKDNSHTNAEFFLFGLLAELSSANSMCGYKLTKVLVKIHVLADKDFQYKRMTHAQIKRQIMESRGILDHLIGEEPSKKNR